MTAAVRRLKAPPVVKLATAEPLQDYFEDGAGNRWSVARLLDDTKNLPVFDVPLAALNLSGRPWDGDNMVWLAFHVRKCMDADLSHPILLSWDGAIADGRHRVLKALALGRATIPARRMHWRPEPCRKGDA